MSYSMTPDDVLARMRERAVLKHKVAPNAELGVVAIRGHAKAEEANGNRDLVVVATTEDIDGEDEVVVASGIDLSHFQTNKAVFVDHMYGVDNCVGVMRRLSPYPSPSDFKGYALRVRMHDEPLANTLLERARAGNGPGASIGFESIDRGPPTEEEAKRYAKDGKPPRSVVRRCRLLEVSLTHFPCNVACQGLSASAAKSMVGGLVGRGVLSETDAKAMGWEPRPRRRVVLLGDAVAVRSA